MDVAQRQGWALIALDCPVDPTTPTGKAMASIVATFAQLERRLIGQRTREALAAKRAAGVQLGRPRQLSNDLVQRIVAERADGVSLRAIADRLNDESGTIVVISKSDGMQYTSTGHFVNALKKSLSQTFRYYLAAGKKILVNGEALKAIDPLHVELDGVKVFSDEIYDFTFKAEDGVEQAEKFRLKMVVLPDFGIDGNEERGFNIKRQGFYVLRNNREIAEATTLGLFTKHGEFNLFRAELSLPATLDAALGVNFMKREVKPIQALGGQAARDHGRPAQDDPRSAEAEDRQERPEDEPARRGGAPHHREVPPARQAQGRDREAGKRTKADNSAEHQNGHDPTKTRKNLKKTQLRPDDLRCRFEQVSLGEGGQIFEAYQEGRTIIVQWNVDHPFYQRFVTQNQGDDGLVTAMDFFIWAWASAELMVYEDGKAAEMLDQMKTLISMNTRTLLK